MSRRRKSKSPITRTSPTLPPNPRLGTAARHAIVKQRKQARDYAAFQERVRQFFDQYTWSGPYALLHIDTIRQRMNDPTKSPHRRQADALEVENLAAVIAYKDALKEAIEVIKRGDDPQTAIKQLYLSIERMKIAKAAHQEFWQRR